MVLDVLQSSYQGKWAKGNNSLTESGSLKSNIIGNKLVETEIGIAKTDWQEIL